MISSEFQVEPDISSGITTIERDHLKNWFKNDRIETSISSLLLSLILHGRLSSSEKNLLELLVPSDTIIFISDREQYIYPEDNDSLPKEFMEISMDQSHNALFTQNCGRTRNNRRKIHSARIGADDAHDIILGFVHSDNGNRTESISSRFTELVNQFRICWKDAAAAATSLTYKTTLPQITVNQTSGRVILINKEMANLLGKKIVDLIDCEYFEISKQLSELPHSGQIKLKQKSIGSLKLAEFALTTSEPITVPNVEKHELLRFLVHGIRNKLTAIASATEQIQDFSVTDESAGELLDIIETATEQLGAHLNRLDLIYNFHSLRYDKSSLIDSINAGIAQISELRPNREIRLGDTSSISDMTLDQPEGSFTTLIFAILNAHIETNPETEKIDITISSSPDSLIIRFSTKLISSDKKSERKSDWLSYSMKLSELMNLKIKQNQENDDQTAVLELHIPNIG